MVGLLAVAAVVVVGEVAAAELPVEVASEPEVVVSAEVEMAQA